MPNIIVVPGWANVYRCVDKLVLALKENFIAEHNVLLFPYDYGIGDVRKHLFGKFADIDELSCRLYSFIIDSRENGLLDPKEPLHFVGYSQGGMIILYTLGKYPDIRQSMGKFVSIATPHGGAFVDELRHMIFEIKDRLKRWLLNKKSFWGPLSAAFLEIAEQISGIKEISAHEDTKFLKEIYPNICKHALHNIPKDRILEIYSESDLVAPPSSVKIFEEYATFFKVDVNLHEKIARDEVVIKKTIQFIEQ